MEKSRDIRRDPEMDKIITSKLFNSILLLTIIGEFFLPWILSRHYDGYNSKMMAMSALGSPQSPVRVIYNTWLIWLGLFFGICCDCLLPYRKNRFPNSICFTVDFNRFFCSWSRIDFRHIPCERK